MSLCCLIRFMKTFKSFDKIMEEENLNETHDSYNGLSCLETNLWLGNLAAATNVQMLKEKKVKYLLTVNSFPLPENIRNLNFIEQKYIEVSDSPQDDLLSHFYETYEFIENGLKQNVVLVHCYHGVSRSATVIISYIMKKKKMTLKEAFEFVKAKCKFIEPNPGFLDQLKLYEIMKCTLDKTNPQYKMFRLDMALNHVRNVDALPKQFADVIQNDPLIMPQNADPTVYKCGKCRPKLTKDLSLPPFSSQFMFFIVWERWSDQPIKLLQKDPCQRLADRPVLTQISFFTFEQRVLARGLNEISHVSNGKYDWRASLEETDVCQLSYFIEPLAWMENVSVSLEGKIHCPNETCRNKLGSFSWVSGVQCPCGTKVRPGFYLIPSKVDKQNACKRKANKVD